MQKCSRVREKCGETRTMDDYMRQARMQKQVQEEARSWGRNIRRRPQQNIAIDSSGSNHLTGQVSGLQPGRTAYIRAGAAYRAR